MRSTRLRFLALIPVLLAAPALADDPPTFQLTVKGNRFEPAEIQVPAGTRFQLLVRNLDQAVMEFESTDLRVERVITAGRETKLRLGPLTPGRYAFFDDFHADTARGALIATGPE